MSETPGILPEEFIVAWEAAQSGGKSGPISMRDLNNLLQKACIGATPEEAAFFLAQLNLQANEVLSQFDHPDWIAAVEGVEPTTHNPALGDPTRWQPLRTDVVKRWEGDPKTLFGPGVLNDEGYIEVPIGDEEFP